jgi:GT2 family glycosyltransferase
MVLRTEALKRIGGFDKQLGRDGGEDADLCWRLERAGWRVVYRPEIEVVHHHRSTIPAMMRQVYWYGRSSSALFARWRGELGWRRYTDRGPYRRLLRGLARALPALLTGRSPYERIAPLLEAADSAAFLTGKYVGSIRNRVPFL